MHSTTECWSCAQSRRRRNVLHDRALVLRTDDLAAQTLRREGPTVFPGLTANPQHTRSPSWSVRLLAAPRSVGSAVFLGLPPTRNTLSVPPRVCSSWPLLAVPRFPGLTANQQHTHGRSWSVWLLAAPCSVGPSSWPLLSVWDPRFSRARNPYTAVNTATVHSARASSVNNKSPATGTSFHLRGRRSNWKLWMAAASVWRASALEVSTVELWEAPAATMSSKSGNSVPTP